MELSGIKTGVFWVERTGVFWDEVRELFKVSYGDFWEQNRSIMGIKKKDVEFFGMK